MTLIESNEVYRTIVETVGRDQDGYPYGASLITLAWKFGLISADELATEMMRLVDEDIAAGRVPATVPNWSELHDHVDANEYNLNVLGLDTSESGWRLSNLVTEMCDARLRARCV